MDLTTAIAQGTASPFLLFGTALLLGALHGLEPGHSKTMMAAFIIAVRGTVGQAVLLGLSAAVSHSIIVWVLAVAALEFGNRMIGEELEPWFMVGSGVLILGIAVWVFFRSQGTTVSPGHHDHDHHNHDYHHHDHDHGHDHRHHGPEDAHARAHASDIHARFADGRTTSIQTVLFGLTGGLIPCSAAITVLILCLHLDRFWFGIGLVSAFSVGLAATLVAAGVAAAVGIRYASRRSGRFEHLLRRAPAFSAALIGILGVAMAFNGWLHLGGA